MLKRLKYRFILVNMIIFSLVLFGTLSGIFVLMYNSEIKMSEEIMNNIIKNLSNDIIEQNIHQIKYNPNEEELKISTLTALYEDLKAKNTAVVETTTPLSNSRIARNEVMYKPLTGLVDIAFDSKVYIKSVFGPSSPQYKQISKLKFVDKKD